MCFDEQKFRLKLSDKRFLKCANTIHFTKKKRKTELGWLLKSIDL